MSLFAQLTVASVQQMFVSRKLQWIHGSTKPAVEYTKLLHFVITEFSLFYFSGAFDPRTLVDATGNLLKDICILVSSSAEIRLYILLKLAHFTLYKY